MSVQICSVGGWRLGSSSVPKVSPTVLAAGRALNKVEPHWLQKPRCSPVSVLSHQLSGPLMLTWSSGTITRAYSGAPVARWQRLQWQARLLMGLAVVL